MPKLIRSKHHISDSPQHLKVVYDEDRKLLLAANAQSKGLGHLLELPLSKSVQVAVMIGTLFAVSSIVIDFTTFYLLEGDGVCHDHFEIGSGKDLIFCFDCIFFVDLMISVARKILKKVPNRRVILIIIEFISLIPLEFIYANSGGRSWFYLHFFRFRYTLRVLRYVGHWEINLRTSSPNFILFQYIVSGIILCFLCACFRILYGCTTLDRNDEETRTFCADLLFKDFDISLAILSGQFGISAMVFRGRPLVRTLLFDGIFQLVVLCGTCFLIPKTVCLFVQSHAPKWDYAVVVNIILKRMDDLKVLRAQKWTFKDEAMVKQVTTSLTANWKYWRLRLHQLRLDNLQDFQVAKMTDVMIREINFDQCWNMYKHSVLFRDEDVAFLRRLAQDTKFKFCMKGESLYDKLEFRSSMIYLISGIITLKPEVNLGVASISLSAGTILGELQLFLSTPTISSIYCKESCEFLVLSRYALLQARNMYPEVYNRLRKKVFNRIVEAKRYSFMSRRQCEQGFVTRNKSHLSMRYIKHVIRKYIFKERFQKQAQLENMNSPMEYRNRYTFKRTVFNAKYLTLYNLDPEKARSLKSHVLVGGFAFKLSPHSSLVELWNSFIYLWVLVHSIYFTLGITFDDPLFTNTYDYFIIVIQFFWIVDFMSYAFIAMEEHDLIIVSIEKMYLMRFASIGFWADFFSAFPLDMIMHFMQGPLDHFEYRILGINRLLKLYKLNNYLCETLAFKLTHFLMFEVYKMSYVIILLTMVVYATFNHFGYFKLLNKLDIEDLFIFKIGVVSQFFFSTSDSILTVSLETNLVPLIFVQWINLYVYVYALSFTIGSLCLRRRKHVRYEMIIDDFKQMFTLYNFAEPAKRKFTRYMHFHYDFGSGELLISPNIMREIIGMNLFKIKRLMMLEHIYKQEGIFQLLPKNVLADISEIGNIVYIPKDELIVVAGSIIKDIYVILNGQCGYVRENLSIIQILEPGQAILVLEAFCGINAVNNVMTLTDCKFLCLPYDNLYQKFFKFDKHTEIYAALQDTVKVDALQKLTYNEAYAFCAMNLSESCRYFNMRKTEYISGFGKFVWAKYILLGSTIMTCGRFWVCWEAVYVICVYIYCFLGTIPITINADGTNWSFYVWRLFDLVLLLNIYLRHHVIYYNGKNIEVQHPWHTAINYWKTSFLVDLLGSFPMEVIALPFFTKLNIQLLSCLRFNKLILLYRAIGLKQYINGHYMKYHHITTTIYFFLAYALLNHIFTVMLLTHPCDVTFQNGAMVDICGLAVSHYWIYYGDNFRFGIIKFFCIGAHERTSTKEYLWRYFIITNVGFILMIVQISITTANTLSRNIYLTLFQIKMKRMVRYMSIKRIDPNMKREIIKHYEHEWNIRQGKVLTKTLKTFSKTSYEETMCFYYASTLENTILFYGFPTAVLKAILSSEKMRREAILITGIPLRVNDVQSDIFILYKGTVQVAAPDNTCLSTLYIGSIFGCLDRVERHRATLNYVAQTHCEFLIINSIAFHDILSKYPRFYDYYMYLLKVTNVDYIPCLKPPQKRKSYTRITKINELTRFRRRLRKCLRLMPILKPNPIRTRFFVVYCLLAFVFESTQIGSFFLIEAKTAVVVSAYIMDTIYWIKIYMEFFTSYENAMGIVVMRRKHIVWRYIRRASGFAFDVMINFPFELITMNFDSNASTIIWSISRANRLLKIIPVYQYVNSIRNRLNVNVTLFQIFYILLVTFTLQQISVIFMSHYIFDQQNVGSISKRYFDMVIAFSYFISMKLFQPYDEEPDLLSIRVDFVIIFPIIVMIIRFVTIFVMAECVSTYQVLTFEDVGLVTYWNNLKLRLKKMDISVALIARIQKNFRSMAEKNLVVQFPEFIAEAPYYLREGLLNCLFGFHLRKHPILGQCHVDLLRQIAATFRSWNFFQGDYITFKNDIDGCLYFIHEGTVEGLVEDNAYYDVADSKFTAGDSFGFKQLILPNVGHYRTYKVVSEFALVVYLNKKSVLPLLNFFPASKHLILKRIEDFDELDSADVELRDYYYYTNLKHK